MIDTKAAARAVIVDRLWLVFWGAWIVWTFAAVWFGDRVAEAWVGSVVFLVLAERGVKTVALTRSVRERLRTNQRYYVQWPEGVIVTKHGRMSVQSFLLDVEHAGAETIARSIRENGTHVDFSRHDVVSCIDDIIHELDRRK